MIKLQSIFLHIAIDMVLFVLIILELIKPNKTINVQWFFNQLYILIVFFTFVYDMKEVGHKIDLYIEQFKKNKEN